MSQVQMEALARQNVGGRWVTVGEKFFTNEKEAGEMEGIRPPLARRVKQPVVPSQTPQPMVQRDMGASEEQHESASTVESNTAEAQPVTTGNGRSGGQKGDGRYAHRSMRSRG